jgi:hypothetical protein
MPSNKTAINEALRLFCFPMAFLFRTFLFAGEQFRV